MEAKKRVIIWGVTAISVIVGIILFNYFVDPYEYYRKASYPVRYDKNQRYRIPGMIRYYDYDSIVIGSSMTRNFLLGDVRKYLGVKKPIKLTPSSTTAYEIRRILDMAFQERNLSAVLCGLDEFAFLGAPDHIEEDVVFPEYLYDDDPWNDYRYLVNFDLFLKSLSALITPLIDRNDPLYDYDKMWQWQHQFPKFSLRRVYATYFAKVRGIKTAAEKNNGKTLAEMKRSFDLNVLPLIRQHPETMFYLFYPPYSILTYLYWNQSGFLSDAIRFKEYVYRQVGSLPNVRLYDFQIEKKIVTNLSIYRDFSHYHQRINTWMLRQMAQDRYRVNAEKLSVISDRLTEMVQHYDDPVVKRGYYDNKP